MGEVEQLFAEIEMKKNLEAAFARPHSEDKDFIHHAQAGMTLRDYFAAKAIHQIIKEAHALEEACDEENDFSFKGTMIPFAKEAYQWADAMLKAREA